jgi:hypothetical protein
MVVFCCVGGTLILEDMVIPYYEAVPSSIFIPYFLVILALGSILLIFRAIRSAYLDYDNVELKALKPTKIKHFDDVLKMLIPVVAASIPMYFIGLGLFSSGFHIFQSTQIQGVTYINLNGLISFYIDIILSIFSMLLLIWCKTSCGGKLAFKRNYGIVGMTLYFISLILLSSMFLSAILSFGKTFGLM